MSIKNIALFSLILSIAIEIITGINITPAAQRTKLGVKQSFEVNGVECEEIIIPNNYKKLVLNLESKSLDRVLITDVRIEKCGENFDLSKCCNRNSTFCIENVNPTQNDFRLNYCIDYTYVYACNVINPNKNMNLRFLEGEVNNTSNNTSKNTSNNTSNNTSISNQIINNSLVENKTLINSNSTTNTTTNTVNDTKNSSISSTEPNTPPVFTYEDKKGSLTVSTAIIKGQGCQTTENVPETECSSIGLVSCKDTNKCSTECSYVECRKELTDPGTRVFAMCLPSKLSDSEVINRCRNHVVFSPDSETSSLIQPQVYKKVCEKREEELQYIPKQSSHAFFKFILIIFGVVILAIFISSVYYRFKMSMDGVPPFEAPAIVPNFIYPRQSNYY